ncbi:MAG: hypothetical protein MAG451_01276 [Anaerolineales bacterium]|nr:hypothetical protein [Anaerolineales bacterium]
MILFPRQCWIRSETRVLCSFVFKSEKTRYHLNISGLCRSKWYFDPTIYQIVLHVPPYIEKTQDKIVFGTLAAQASCCIRGKTRFPGEHIFNRDYSGTSCLHKKRPEKGVGGGRPPPTDPFFRISQLRGW